MTPVSPVGGEVDVARLREVAEAATPGPWDLDVLRFGCWEVNAPTLNGEGDPRVFRFRVGDHMVERDAEHIATFDPPTVLALIARLEAAESARDEALAVVEPVKALAQQAVVRIGGSHTHWREGDAGGVCQTCESQRQTQADFQARLDALTPSAPTIDRVLCWCRPGSPDLPVTSPHAKNDRCTRMTGSLADGLVTPSAPTEEER
jgi:hypothetical protein